MRGRRSKLRWGVGLLLTFLGLVLSGCDNFFVKPTNNGGPTPVPTGSNRVYVLNSQAGTISGFAIGTGTLTALPGSPYTLSVTPIALTVSRNDGFLYLSSSSGIYAFPIAADGSLSSPTLVAAVLAPELSLDISPDGQWLFGLSSLQQVLDEWQINPATGALTAQQSATYTAGGNQVVPRSVRVSPAGDYLFAALGTGGDAVFSLDTQNGHAQQTQYLSLGSALVSDNAVAVDGAGTTLYVARSGQGGGLAVFSIGAQGVLNAVSGSPFATGAQPYDVVLDSASKYVYVANRGDGTVSGYTSASNGGVAALAGSPFASGTGVTALGLDNTGKYLAAAAFGGSPDLSLYSFSASVPGALVVAAKAATGDDATQLPQPTAVALTH